MALDSTWQGATQTALPNTWTKSINYQERIAYDPNGNIKTYTRNANTGVQMDNLAYNYYTGTNRLQQVTDGVAAASFTTDIDNQTNASNYIYDGVGNLISDASESLAVTWSPYGKVLDATRTGIKTLYGYDAMQNRVVKTFIQATDTTRSFYIRDAQGNTMAVYTRRLDTIKWTEQHLYGSSRLGIWEPNQRLTPSVDTSKKWQIREGQKKYELTNHLGNVLVTVNDRRKGTDTNADTFFDVYDGVEITATDYYPFGLEMPGRTFQATAYRFGFNGKENDRTSWSATQLVQDYGMRLYNPAIGKFLSVDPLFQSFPWNSPYSYAENDPINFIDLDGAEKSKPEITNATMTRLSNDSRIQTALSEAQKDQRIIMSVTYNDRGTVYNRTDELRAGTGSRPSTLAINWTGSYSGGRQEGQTSVTTSTHPFSFTPVQPLSTNVPTALNISTPPIPVLPPINIIRGGNGGGTPIPIVKPAPQVNPNIPIPNRRIPAPINIPQAFLPFAFGDAGGAVIQGPVAIADLRRAVNTINASGQIQFFFNVRIGLNGGSASQTRLLINSANNGLNNLMGVMRTIGLNNRVRITPNIIQDNGTSQSTYNLSTTKQQ